MVQDTIADTITRLYNSSVRRSVNSEVIASKTVGQILEVMKKTGFIVKYELVERKHSEGGNVYVVTLKYDEKREPKITKVKRISKTGCRIYKKHSEIRKVLSGRGLGVYSTPMGILSDKDAYLKKTGGEYLFEIW